MSHMMFEFKLIFPFFGSLGELDAANMQFTYELSVDGFIIL